MQRHIATALFFTLTLAGCEGLGTIAGDLVDDDDDSAQLDDDDDSAQLDDDDDDTSASPCASWAGAWWGHLVATTRCYNHLPVDGVCVVDLVVEDCAIELAGGSCDPVLELELHKLTGQLDDDGQVEGYVEATNGPDLVVTPWAGAVVHGTELVGLLDQADTGNCSLAGSIQVYRLD